MVSLAILRSIQLFVDYVVALRVSEGQRVQEGEKKGFGFFAAAADANCKIEAARDRDGQHGQPD